MKKKNNLITKDIAAKNMSDTLVALPAENNPKNAKIIKKINPFINPINQENRS